jgi:hypothetical protein
MPATVHVQLQLWIVRDNGTVFTDTEILRFRKSPGRLEALDLSLQEGKTLQEVLPYFAWFFVEAADPSIR